MRISKSRNAQRQVAYTVELSEYDAEPPTRIWLLDAVPDKINPELEAVALYLIFGPWCGGEFIVPQKMGPNTASAIRTHSGMDFFSNPIEYYPKPIFRGARSIRLVTTMAGHDRDSLVSLSSSDWSGSLKSPASLIIASNSELFACLGETIRPHLAVALMLAEELNLGAILLDSTAGDIDSGLADLLRQVGVLLCC